MVYWILIYDLNIETLTLDETKNSCDAAVSYLELYAKILLNIFGNGVNLSFILDFKIGTLILKQCRLYP